MKGILDEILEKLPEEFNLMELTARAEEKTPYVLVALQECERMNTLTSEMKRSLRELDLGLKVQTLLYPIALIHSRSSHSLCRVSSLSQWVWRVCKMPSSLTMFLTAGPRRPIPHSATSLCGMLTCSSVSES